MAEFESRIQAGASGGAGEREFVEARRLHAPLAGAVRRPSFENRAAFLSHPNLRRETWAFADFE
jgi:hypothetical protein